jgi:aminoglycoside 6'-N-acetyltransferase
MNIRIHPGQYSFRRASHDDLPMLRRWLRTPEVMRWWGEPDEQYALLQEDLGEPRMTMRVVCFGEEPLAYAQDYEVHSWPQPHLEKLPAGTRAIDAFIGEADMLGRGHGSHFLRLLAEQLIRDGAPGVVIDPDVDNLRARRAYEKAGFRVASVVETEQGPAVLMIFGGAQPA